MKASATPIPRELTLYHVMEVVRAMSECACEDDDGGDGPDSEGRKRRNSKDDKFRTLLRDLIMAEVSEDDADGYRSLRRMDISLSDGDDGAVGGIIMEGYRDTLAEETKKIRDNMPDCKIFHSECKAVAAGKSSTSSSSAESNLFILLNDKLDPRAEIRRQLTTLKVKAWTKGDGSEMRLTDHSQWPPDAKTVKEEMESIVNFLRDATREKIRLSVVPKVRVGSWGLAFLCGISSVQSWRSLHLAIIPTSLHSLLEQS